jgi:hypothetical protein
MFRASMSRRPAAGLAVLTSAAATALLVALAGPAHAANDTGDVLGVYHPNSNCTGAIDGTFDDAFVDAAPGTSKQNPVPSGAHCVRITNLSNLPVQGTVGCGSEAVTVPPGQTQDLEFPEVCFYVGITVVG